MLYLVSGSGFETYVHNLIMSSEQQNGKSSSPRETEGSATADEAVDHDFAALHVSDLNSSMDWTPEDIFSESSR